MNTKPYLRINRDKLLADTNSTNLAGSVEDDIVSLYQVSGNSSETTGAYLYNRIAPDAPVKIVNNNCLTLPHTCVYFNKNDLSPNVSKVDFWWKSNSLTVKSYYDFIAIENSNFAFRYSRYGDSNGIYLAISRIEDGSGVRYVSLIVLNEDATFITDGQWHHLIADFTTQTITIDATVYNLARLAAPSFNFNNGSSISSTVDTSSFMELKMYDSSNNLLHYFPMQEGDGDCIYDAKSHITGYIQTSIEGNITTVTTTNVWNETQDVATNNDNLYSINKCINLTNGYVAFLDNIISGNTTKIDTWVKFNNVSWSTGNRLGIFTLKNPNENKWWSIIYGKHSSTQTMFVYRAGTLDSTSMIYHTVVLPVEDTLVQGMWYHLTFDVNTLTVTVDDKEYTLSDGGTTTTTIPSNTQLGRDNNNNRSMASFVELKMYDSNNNLLHYFPLKEGTGTIIHNVPKENIPLPIAYNCICGRVVPTSFTNTYYPSRAFVESLWANKQDLFAYNTVNGWYSLKYDDMRAPFLGINTNIKLPAPYFYKCKSLPITNGLGYGYFQRANTSGVPEPVFSINNGCIVKTTFAQGTTSSAPSGYYNFIYQPIYVPYTYTYNHLINTPARDTDFNGKDYIFKFHYIVNGQIPPTSAYIGSDRKQNLVTLAPTDDAVTIEGDIVGDQSIFPIGNFSNIPTFEMKFPNIKDSTLPTQVTIEYSNIELCIVDPSCTKLHAPIPNGLNGSEASLQFADDIIYTPGINATFGANAPTYSTREGAYGEQNIVHYVENQESDNFLRLENKLNNLSEGKTLITKPTVNIFYPKMYPSIPTNVNWGRWGCSLFKTIGSYDVANEIITYKANTTYTTFAYTQLYCGVHSDSFSKGYHTKCMLTGIKAKIKHSYITDTDNNIIPVTLCRIDTRYMSKSEKIYKTVQTNSIVLNDDTQTEYKYMIVSVSKNILNDAEYFNGIIIHFDINNYTITPISPNYTLTIEGLHVDLIGYEPIDTVLRNSDGTIGNGQNIECMIRYPQDPEYNEIVIP